MTEKKYNIITVGESGVGKTSLLHCFATGSFGGDDATSTTLKVEQMETHIKVDGNTTVHLRLFDTAGQEQLRSLTDSYYRCAHGVFLVYDVTDNSTFEKLVDIYNTAYHYLEDEAVYIVIGNKTDEEMSKVRVDKSEGDSFAQQHGFQHFRTSAKKNINVKEAFQAIAKEMVERIGKDGFVKSSRISVRPRSEESRNGCRC